MSTGGSALRGQWPVFGSSLLVIVAVVALSVWAIYPPDETIKLGLDLKGGVKLVLQVKTRYALRGRRKPADSPERPPEGHRPAGAFDD